MIIAPLATRISTSSERPASEIKDFGRRTPFELQMRTKRVFMWILRSASFARHPEPFGFAQDKLREGSHAIHGGWHEILRCADSAQNDGDGPLCNRDIDAGFHPSTLTKNGSPARVFH